MSVLINFELINYIIDRWHQYYLDKWKRTNGQPTPDMQKNISLIANDSLRSNMYYIFAKNYSLDDNDLSIYQIIKTIIKTLNEHAKKYIFEISPNNIYCDFENKKSYSITKKYYYILLPFIKFLKKDNYFLYLMQKIESS